MEFTVESYSLFTDSDVSLFREGKHFKLYEKFGAQVLLKDGVPGTYFAVWAPNAQSVSVFGSFNGWNPYSHELYPRWDKSGIWEGFIPHVGIGASYKYRILSYNGIVTEKADPFALRAEHPPETASVVSTTWYEWADTEWMSIRNEKNALNQPYSVYELHLGSWIRDPSEPERLLTYQEIADKLVPYILELGFTHVEFMPVMEHPYYPSWGYQITGFYAASSRYGTAQELMCLIERLHQNGIGVILDWVPSHFPGDAHGLHFFDGSHLYEHEDPRQGFHPDWGSYIFNYGRPEVRSFLISNAIFWLDRYHADGLRVDAVASMLHLDYSRKAGEWIPNKYGGRENLEAVVFLKDLNEAVYHHFPDVQTIAEDSTSWPGVSRPVFSGGLGFGMKWMMGWMNDTLAYFSKDPLIRQYHHNHMTFSSMYAYDENFLLPFSHDEVVHGKASLIYKMPGDEWQQFANLRALYAYMFTYSGSKLLFMGCEFGQTSEWNFTRSLDWHLLQFAPHKGLFEFIKALNHLYKSEPAMYEYSFSHKGFEWMDADDKQHSILTYMRKGLDAANDLLVLLNLTPIVRYYYRCGLPQDGSWQVVLNSDDPVYHGSGVTQGTVVAEDIPWMNKPYSALLTLPPLAVLVLKRVPPQKNKKSTPRARKSTAAPAETNKTVKTEVVKTQAKRSATRSKSLEKAKKPKA